MGWTLALDAGFTQILNEQTTQSCKLVFADLADGQYYLKLRTQDWYGLQSIDATHFFHVKTLLPELLLELLEPLDEPVIPLAPTYLSWTPLSASTNYLVQVAGTFSLLKIYTSAIALNNRLIIN